VRNAVRLCDGFFSLVATFDGDRLHLVAHHQVGSEGIEALRQAYPMHPNRGHVAGRAILDRVVVHVPDVLADPDYAHAVGRAVGNRSTLSIPMLREGQAIGTSIWTRS